MKLEPKLLAKAAHVLEQLTWSLKGENDRSEAIRNALSIVPAR